MGEKLAILIDSIKALLDYIEAEQVYDKLADAGCGYIDSYRSEKFDKLIKATHEALAFFQTL